MASACGEFIRSAAASISSLVVRPLPHSCAMSRNGALVIPAIGARRVVVRISTGPIFMLSRPAYTRGRPALSSLGLVHPHLLVGPRRPLDPVRHAVEVVLLPQEHPRRLGVHQPLELGP